MAEAYPLHWPLGNPRTKSRTNSKLRSTISSALSNVQDELRRFGNDTGNAIKDIVISSNCSLGNYRPTDPGVAVYFRWSDIDCCIAVDRYYKVEENLQAIAKIVEAERAKMRHGGLNIVRSSFRGYASLPPPTGVNGQLAKPWRQVLFGNADIAPSVEQVETRYRELVKEAHPDRGGDAASFNSIVDAVRQAREELR